MVSWLDLLKGDIKDALGSSPNGLFPRQRQRHRSKPLWRTEDGRVHYGVRQHPTGHVAPKSQRRRWLEADRRMGKGVRK